MFNGSAIILHIDRIQLLFLHYLPIASSGNLFLYCRFLFLAMPSTSRLSFYFPSEFCYWRERFSVCCHSPPMPLQHEKSIIHKVCAGVRWVGIWPERMRQVYVRIHSEIGFSLFSECRKVFFSSFGIARSATWNFIFDFAWAIVQRIENFHKYRCDELMVCFVPLAQHATMANRQNGRRQFFFRRDKIPLSRKLQ